MSKDHIRDLLVLLASTDLHQASAIETRHIFLDAFCKLIGCRYWKYSVSSAEEPQATPFIGEKFEIDSVCLTQCCIDKFSEPVEPLSIEVSGQSQCGIRKSLSFYRTAGERPLDKDQVVLTETACKMIPWVFTCDIQEAASYSLSPRLQQIYDLIIEGYSDKEIAGRLELKTVTVNSYVKQVFKKVMVSSRPELLAKVMRGEV